MMRDQTLAIPVIEGNKVCADKDYQLGIYGRRARARTDPCRSYLRLGLH